MLCFAYWNEALRLLTANELWTYKRRGVRLPTYYESSKGIQEASLICLLGSVSAPLFIILAALDLPSVSIIGVCLVIRNPRLFELSRIQDDIVI